MLLPAPLKSGDLLSIVSPAGPVDSDMVSRGVKQLENWGYRVCLAAHVSDRNGYLAGTDQDRADDLVSALTDPIVKGIICSRGGYGAARILGRIPWSDLKRMQPKTFVGFSDIGAIQLSLWSKSNWGSFSGPQAAFGLGGKLSRRAAQHLRSMLDGSFREIAWSKGDDIFLGPVRHGECQGTLVACCLSVLCSMIGTEYFPDLKGTVLCLEDIEEPLYRVDRMFWQLHAAGVMKSVSGIVLGAFRWHENELVDRVAEIVREIFTEYDFPIWKGLPYGHIDDRLTIPIGVDCSIRENGSISLVNGEHPG